MRTAFVSFEHLLRLSDDIGLMEHADHTEPRPEHGYCVDDVARGLVALARQPNPSAQLVSLMQVYLRFVSQACAEDGRFHNRRGAQGSWQDVPSVQDCWGRALWGLGTAAGRCPELAPDALDCFNSGARARSPWTRAMAFAALGAAEVLGRWPEHPAARRLLADAADRIGGPGSDPSWVWPEPRLRYANAVLADALIAAGSMLQAPPLLARGLAMLAWLLRVETGVDHLSVTPVGGWAPPEPRPGFDQQPIEVAALADACSRAFEVTGQPEWGIAVVQCAAWFDGDNDAAVAMVDHASGGGCDGLEIHGRNENQGAESTLAMITTFQQVASLRAERRPEFHGDRR